MLAGLRARQSFSAIPLPDPPVIRRGASGTFYDKGLEGASHHAVIPNVNTIDKLPEIWPRLSPDEKKLFDVIARAYLAALMPDFRYRQTTATLDVRGFEFRSAGRQPIDLGWRAAFPEWQPADEKGDEAQLLPLLHNGETAQLQDPKIEDKETRPPPRYNEGTLIEAMQNAWRFVEDEILRDRLKEAKGIGTPATRAEIIGGLKKQGFLIAQGKNIVPTETGLSLFGILKQADPALVDPGVTAQLECLLDDVVVGKQEMVGAIDAVCDVAERIIGRLKESATAGGTPLRGDVVGNGAAAYPPTPAMKRLPTALAGRASNRRLATRRRFRSAENFSAITRPRKPTVKRLGGSTLNRQARHSCCTLRRSRSGKASSFPTRPRPTRLQWPRGLTRTRARSAARAVARPPTSRRDQFHLNRRRRRRDLGNARLMPSKRLLLCQISE
jgi:DNA topoisomerase-3